MAVLLYVAEVSERADEKGLTLWVDTLYTDAMQIETVPFGSDCYFALANESNT